MWYYYWAEKNAMLAQLDRVTGYEPVGQGFESLASHQIPNANAFGILLIQRLFYQEKKNDPHCSLRAGDPPKYG